VHEIDELPDDKLIERVEFGDEQSFAVLVGRYRVKALHVAYGILQSRADAEDAVQEAFIRIYRHLGKFRGTGCFSSWLYKVVVNESLRLLRTRRLASTKTESYSPPGATADKDTEAILVVKQCLSDLPIKYRTVLALRAIKELDYAEIAGIIEAPVGTVRSRLNEARRLFAERWKELMGDEV